MKFSEFIGPRRTLTQLAKDLGYSRERLSQVISGKVPMSKKLAREIERFTNGKLKAEELLKENKELFKKTTENDKN